jgi:putative peptidoglycan lipid II flippase
MAVLKNSLIVAGWTMVSRVLGFARDLLIANKLGAGVASDAFFIALQLPNLLRRLLGEGAFNVAFVPLLAKEQAKGHEHAKAFAEAVMGWLLLILSAISVLGFIFMPLLVTAMVSGWVNDPERFNLAVTLGRITFPYVLLICLAAFYGAICNTAGRFSAYAMVPSLLNLAFILGLFAFPGLGLEPSHAAAWSVPLGGLAQVAYMVWETRRAGYTLRLRFPHHHPNLKPLLYRIGPAALGVGVLQLSLIIDNQVASWIEGVPVVTYLQMANRFYQFPLALIGIAVATVLLPHLSVLLGKGDKTSAGQSFQSALLGCLTLATGCTVGLLLLAPEILTTLIAHGEYSSAAARATAWAMMGFVLGLPAYIVAKVTAPAFFANQDTVSPVKAGAIALAVNFVFNVLFVWYCINNGLTEIAHVGIALATAIGGYVNATLQWRWLQREGVFAVDVALWRTSLARMALVAVGMAVPILLFKLTLPYQPEDPFFVRAVWLAFAAAIAGGSFAAMVHLTGLIHIPTYIKLLKRGRRGPKEAADITSES